MTELHARCCLDANQQYSEQDENGRSVKSALEGLDEWPHSWPQGTITWRLDTFTPDIENQKHQERTITVALRSIGIRVKNIRFKRVRAHEEADLRITFTSQDRLFLERPSVLAYAYFPTENPRQDTYSGDVVFNDRHDWDIYGRPRGQFKQYPLLHVAMHEIGHSLGLKHDTVESNAVMYPYAKQPSHPNAFYWHERDLVRLRERYGTRSINQRILDYLLRRRLDGSDFK